MSREEPFTVEDGLAIQAKQLAEWKTKLIPECYQALEDACKQQNNHPLERPVDGYMIMRGTQLDAIVSNWKPNKNSKWKSPTGQFVCAMRLKNAETLTAKQSAEVAARRQRAKRAGLSIYSMANFRPKLP
jgi:hypothetical protein